MSRPIAVGDVVEVFGILAKVIGFSEGKLILKQPGKKGIATINFSDVTKHFKEIKNEQ